MKYGGAIVATQEGRVDELRAGGVQLGDERIVDILLDGLARLAPTGKSGELVLPVMWACPAPSTAMSNASSSPKGGSSVPPMKVE